jgi:type IX secretion system PorP/SprF family membrane protein
MKKLIAPILLFVLSSGVYAQDPHFSQFFSSPLTLNPAFTGKFDGAIRITGDYRNQWPTINNAFITSTGSVDFHVGQKIIPSNDNWGVGFSALNDNSAAGAVNFNYFSLSTAYHKGLDEDGFHQLSLGVQATYANMFINTSSLKFEDQLTPFGFTGPTQEPFNGATLSSNYVDLNAGLLYSGSSNEKNNFYGGVSLYHINQPTQKLTSGTGYQINPRATFQAGTYFAIGPATTLHFSGLETIQGGASETVLGGAFQFIANPEEDYPTSLYVGSWIRLNDAIIPYLGLEYNSVRLGITYDVNTSSLKTASQNQGGIEISAIYIYRPNTDKPINCPKF